MTRNTVLGLALAIVVVLSGEARGGPTDKQELPELQTAKRAYAEGRFQESIEQLSPLLIFLTDDDARCEAAFLLGLNHLALGNGRESGEYFASAVRSDPAFLPSERDYPRASVLAFEYVRAGLIGELVVEAEPMRGRVLLAGEPLGTTPLRQEVLAGDYILRVEAEGHTPQERPVTVVAKERTSVSVSLEPIQAIAQSTQTREASSSQELPKNSETSGSKLPFVLVGLGAAGGGAAVALTRGGGNDSQDVSMSVSGPRSFAGMAPPDRNFNVAVGQGGILSARLVWSNGDVDLDLALYRGSCVNPGSFVGCQLITDSIAGMGTTTEQVSFSAAPGPYTVLVNHYAGGSASYTLTITLP